jgi:cardiolipin synthase
MKLLIDSPAFMAQLERDLGQATRSICVQTMSFEGDAVGRRLADLLLARPDLERTLIIDRYSLFYLNDRFLPAPWNAVDASLWRERSRTLRLVRQLRRGGVEVCWTNPVGALLRKFVARNHKKSALIDDRIAYIGGVNFSEHNFRWHDLMLRIDDERVGAFLREDIRATLRGENLSDRRDFGEIEVLLLDGVDNARLNQPILQLIHDARASIVLQSAYLSFPFFGHLAEAVRRGVSVTLLAPGQNNKPRLNAYTQWAAASAGITLRLSPGGMSHVKAMLVDDEVLVAGSSNFDFLSYYSQQEVVAIVRSRPEIEQYRRDVLDPDLSCSVAPTRTISPAWEAWRERTARRIFFALHAISRLPPAGRAATRSREADQTPVGRMTAGSDL